MGTVVEPSVLFWSKLRDQGLTIGGMRQTLQDSFSAVSKPNFASKDAFESSRRDLHNALLCTALKAHFFVKTARMLPKNCEFFKDKFAEFCKLQRTFWQNFDKKLRFYSSAKECIV